MQYIARQLPLDFCYAEERKQGTRVGMRWWEQEIIDLAGARKTVEAAEEVDEDGMEE